MEAVRHQIDEHLNKLVSVCMDRRQISLDHFFHRDAVVSHPLLEHLQAILHDLTEIDNLSILLFPPGKNEELVHDLGDSFDLRDNRGKALLHPFIGGALEQIFCASEDHVHRRADFVRHAGSQCAKLRNPFRFAKLFLDRFEIGDIEAG